LAYGGATGRNQSPGAAPLALTTIVGTVAKITAAVLALLVLALAAAVVLGMVVGIDPQLDNARAQTWVLVTQEALGAGTLFVLALVARRLRRVAGGNGLGLTVVILLGAMLLAAAWLLALVIQRSS
jgi:hypothetical protein